MRAEAPTNVGVLSNTPTEAPSANVGVANLTPPGEVERVVEEYGREGFARLGRIAPEATLEAMRARARDLMLGRLAYPGMFFQQDTETGRYEDLEYGLGWQGPSLNYRKIEKLEMDPVFRAWIEHELFECVARAVLGPGGIVIYRATLFGKAACGGTELPWHQDAGRFWGLDRDPVLQIWTALDDATRDAGCLEIVPRSHLDGLATPLGGLVPERIVKERAAEERGVAVPAEAGEVIVLHNYAWHRSGVNRTAMPRRAVSVCYMSAETRCTRKKRAARQFVRVFE
jgi:hypothetical protein